MKKRIQRSFARLQKTYIILSREKKNIKRGSNAEWLLDNFYIFAQEYSALRNLRIRKKRVRRQFEAVYLWAESYLAQKEHRFEAWALSEALEQKKEEHPFSAEALAFLPAAFSAALFVYAADLCENPYETGYMGNVVKSLLSLRELDMKALFEQHSLLDAVLMQDVFFSDMTPNTKNEYRRATALLCAECGKSDAFIAEKALSLTQNKKGAPGHVGYYLIGDGENELRAALSLKPKKKRRLSTFYFLSAFTLTAVFLTIIRIVTGRFLWVFLTALPVLDISLQLLQYCMLKATPVRPMMRLALSEGIPEKVLVVYPTLLSSPEKAKEMADKLEICYLANRDENLHFAVLGDFKDSDSPHEDPEIPAACAKRIDELNQKYGARFHLLCRGQVYAPMQKKWMGEERKRGALSDLNSFLCGCYTFRYTAGATDALKGIRYVLTLDDDTLLPPDAARNLVGTALHPLHTPQVRNGRVVSGYGIIEPRVSMRLESANRSFFSRVFAGHGGMDTYHTSVSEFYMDVFGESVFTGKGIYHVDTFLACASFPKDSVLSHDLLEGCYLRCGLASDIQVFDSFPHRLAAHSMRQHRWVRGDWQIVPWLFRSVRNQKGEKVQNPLSPLSRWKIFDNLRRSVTPLLQLLLFASGATLPVLTAFISLSLPLLFSLLNAAMQKSFFHFGEKRTANIIVGARLSLYQITLSFVFLAHTAYVNLSGAILGLWRSFSHRRTLEWVTASDAEHNKVHTLRASFISMLPSVLFALVLLLVSLSDLFYFGGLELVFSAVWIFAPVLAYISGLEAEPDTYTLSEKNKALLTETSTRIWHFFRDYMTAEENFLPPDNVQVKPYKGIAHRTSPTNIGLGILACLCACDLGLISREEMAERIEKTIDTVEKLRKWYGHLYNWYDTRTLKPLPPRYISTVDSGNFACYLLTAAMGIRDHFGTETPLSARLIRFVQNTDFRPLYNEKKKLFSIGYSLEENRLTDSYYDLLISEARQTGFLAIALGQIPTEHWFSLGRGLVEADGYRGLVSWSGTMFEYFMPPLIMKKYENSLLAETYRFALSCQKRYAKRRRVPWGVSESGFYAFDNEGNYQYKAFGVPELGLCRQSEDDVVITPYATLLALMEDPRAAIANMHLLRRDGLYGEYGFFEAADYSPVRRVGNMRRGIVKSYMAHHQGMSLAAITNLLCQNTLQHRFHSYPAIRAAEPLLKERVPVGAPVIKDRHERVSPVRYKWQESVRSVREMERENTFPRPIQLLSNGSYHVSIDTAGQGYSSLDDVRFNSFSPLWGGGQNIWIINPVTGQVLDGYGTKSIFAENSAVFQNYENAVATRLTVSVFPEDTCECRRLTLINQTDKKRAYEIYYFVPLSLAPAPAENAHPAFSKLFVTTKEKDGVLYATRRKRSEKEKSFVAFASAEAEGSLEGNMQFDTDRLSFFGRGTPLPHSLSSYSILAQKTGTVLDPCFAIKIRLSAEPGMSSTVTFLSGLAETEEKASQIVRKYKNNTENIKPVPRESAVIFKEGEEDAFLRAASYMLYGGAPIEEIEKARQRNLLPKNTLWKFGISGDIPILTVRLTETADGPILEEAIKAHTFWKDCGIITDLVVYCDEPGSYTHPVFAMAEKMKKTGMYILGRRDISPSDYDLILAASSLYISASSGGFSCLPAFKPLPEEKQPRGNPENEPPKPISLLFDNGCGGFDTETGDYIIEMTKAGQTPMPWVHVVANESFGFIAGEGGSGYTWSENSHEFRLSPWTNDPVRDPLSEWLTLSSENDIWSPMAAVFPEQGFYRTRYGAGYVTYERNTRKLMHTVTMFTPPGEKKKIISVSLTNHADVKRDITLEYSFLPVLGTNPAPDAISVLETGQTVRIRNGMTDAAREVYLTASGTARCGRKGQKIFANTSVSLKPRETKTIVFTLGEGAFEETDSSAAFQKTRAFWDGLLGTLTVETHDAATDLLLNRWLLYQAVACRIFARSAFYQSGGAYGFRDQLQDSLSLLDVAPHLVKKQIKLHAAHQFTEGDVFHWWHTDEKGVRTRFSDDRLFLPYVAAIYAEETGDDTIWSETESFIIEPPLSDGEEERYTFVKERTEPYSIYEHCIRAIDISLKKGAHGLPLMGGGDWNDGMNTVGIKGQGESVWLCWFLKVVLDKFVPVCTMHGDTERAERYKREALLLLEAAESEAWDGTHYARAFFDDASPLGTSVCAECGIDAISQAWAVIAGGARRDRLRSAMDSVYRILLEKEHSLLRLLAPSFENSTPSPGYIQSYPKGLRENGGQYTHGAIWAVIAFSMLGENEKAWELFRMLNPIHLAETPHEVNTYKVDPYVMAADIYTAPGHEGRGGWSWYTGAAAWMYRLGIRHILGFQKRGNTVSFSPSMPLGEKGFTLRYCFGSSLYIFHVHGKSEEITLIDDGKTHEITL